MDRYEQQKKLFLQYPCIDLDTVNGNTTPFIPTITSEGLFKDNQTGIMYPMNSIRLATQQEIEESVYDLIHSFLIQDEDYYSSWAIGYIQSILPELGNEEIMEMVITQAKEMIFRL